MIGTLTIITSIPSILRAKKLAIIIGISHKDTYNNNGHKDRQNENYKNSPSIIITKGAMIAMTPMLSMVVIAIMRAIINITSTIPTIIIAIIIVVV
jgi:hypothetical protein